MRKRKLAASIVALVALAIVAAPAVSVGASAPTGRSGASPQVGVAFPRTPMAAGERRLARQIARARVATAGYATDLEAAQADGYRIITRMIPDMGYHFLNFDITEFDVTRPPILVYEHDVRSDTWQLAAFEWVFTEEPAQPPLPGATYGAFGAACHYDDGTFVFESDEASCPATSPDTGTPFVFWHPDLVTLHLWLWYPNPSGVYSGTNPTVFPFNAG